MKEKKGFFSNLLQLITYTEKTDPEEFIIPEVYNGNNKKESVDNKNNEVKKDNSDIKNAKSRNGSRHIIKDPATVQDLKDKKGKNTNNSNDTDDADINTISTNIKANIDFIKEAFNFPVNKDIVVREFYTSDNNRAFVAFIDGMADRSAIDDFILRPLMNSTLDRKKDEKCTLGYIHDYILEINQTKKVYDHKDAISEILMGDTILYIDRCDFYIACETKGFDKRGVEKPQTESVVKGPLQGLNENLKTNITLMRRIIKNSSLTTEYLQIGERSNTTCAIVYIKDLVNPAIVNEVKRRINNAKTDFISSAGMLEQLIEDNPKSIIPTILSTERPDRAASHLFEGKVAIFIDGTPFTMIVPVTFYSLLHSPEDAALKWHIASSMRFIRLFAIGIASFLPGFYIAITTFHREMIPTDILLAIAKSKENVPFPSLIEILMMEVGFELIREAGIRIPGLIGNTIGIIGALILGQAAVEANLVNPALIIVIAVTGLGNFAIPNYSLSTSVRLLRFAYIIAGALLGFYGIALGLIALMVILVSHKSFGVPYMAPVSPKTNKSRDVIIRWPIWKQELRPDYVNPLDIRRQPEISRQWVTQNPEGESGNKNE